MKLLFSFFIIVQYLGALDLPNLNLNSVPTNWSLIPLGASNRNYVVTEKTESYFIRIAPTPQALYADLGIEYETLFHLSTLGITPKPLHYDESLKLLAIEWIDHDHQPLDLTDPAFRKLVINKLKQIAESQLHISRTFHPYNDIKMMVEASSDQFGSKFLEPLAEISQILNKFSEKSICHLDLHQFNILKKNDEIWLIDWEYAAMSHPFLTLASIASIARWDDSTMFALLTDWKDTPTKTDQELLYLYRIVIDLFWSVWNHVQITHSSINSPYETWSFLFTQAAEERLSSEEFQSILRNHL